ncbi:MAG: hypothetical protein OEX10_01770 [Candidatus Bathyarchaeota archaeon]|nr:hypothetical protein [Candidatus Bathyarchaeota archaeon]MDH5662941.1 hypothetical protein [Candidatus Bathyarchaeota archaeon]
MKKLKVAILALITLTVALTATVIYCSWALDRELSKYGYREDLGLFVDPRFDYLEPFRIHLLFLRYAWIAFVILGVLWIAVGIRVVQNKEKTQM